MLSVTVVNVDTFDDVIDSGDGLTSLREAVIAANASSNDYQIVLPAGTYALTSARRRRRLRLHRRLGCAQQRQPLDHRPWRRQHDDRRLGVVRRQPRLWRSDPGREGRRLAASLEGLTLTGGSTQAFGGAINLSGNDSATISDCTFTGNSGGDGGAIYSNLSMLTISAGTFTDNSAVSGGGARACQRRDDNRRQHHH